MRQRRHDAQGRRREGRAPGGSRDQGSRHRLNSLKRFDLHTHSSYSDGTLPPVQVAAKAKAAGVQAFFLTDHDTVAGFSELSPLAPHPSPLGVGMTVHCGVEINAVSDLGEVHILGYGAKWKDEGFERSLALFRERRQRRAERIVQKLKETGLDISFEDVAAVSRQTLGRPHIADALKKKGIVKTRDEAFRKYLYRGKPGYVEPMGPTPEEAISLIKEAGGFASLAHPGTVKDLSKLGDWKALGLEGLEVYYGTHGPSDIAYYARIGEECGLMPTGGSDFHGPGTGRSDRPGVDVPDEVFARFMERLGS